MWGLFMAVAGVGHIINIYPPSPDLTVGCLVPDRGWSRHYVCGPRERRGLLPMFCIRAEREERVMLFVTAIPWGADGGGEMFNVVRHLLFTEKLWLLDLLTHSCYTHTDLSC